jgi:hypothetical protein
MTGAITAALVLDGVRAMSPSERDELLALLGLANEASAERDPWMDSSAAAEYLGIHRDTLRKLAATGAIRSDQERPTCKRYFTKGGLDEWRSAGGRFHAASMRSKSPVRAGAPR